VGAEELSEDNRYRLADRVSGLIEQNGALGLEVALPDKETFVRRIVKTRNHLTHRVGDTESVLVEPARSWHAEALAWLVRASLLRDLGFDASDVERRVRQNLRFGGFLERLRESLPK
jgi:hypothetical protein